MLRAGDEREDHRETTSMPTLPWRNFEGKRAPIAEPQSIDSIFARDRSL